MAYTYAEYDALLKKKDAVQQNIRDLKKAKLQLTEYLDSSGPCAAQYLRNAWTKIAAGDSWTGAPANSAMSSLKGLEETAIELSSYIVSTCDAILTELEQEDHKLSLEAGRAAADLDLLGNIEALGRSFTGNMRR